MPGNVKDIINVLQDKGYEAYAVGGCVRDAVLGKEPHDWDITTSALPEKIKELFSKTVDTGIEHGTVTVIMNGEGYEVTTYRIDGKYKDGRHPESVTFTPSLTEDLKRRDFTINAMAYNESEGLVDLFGGIGDIEKKKITCVGNPVDRFNEDALRILRAVRFAGTLGFDIEENTLKACSTVGKRLELVSRERIQVELDKLITSDHPEKIEIAWNVGIMEYIVPELNFGNGIEDSACGKIKGSVAGKVEKSRGYEDRKFIIDMLKVTENNHYVRWAALLSVFTRDEVRRILKGLKFDNKTVKYVSSMVERFRGEAEFKTKAEVNAEAEIKSETRAKAEAEIKSETRAKAEAEVKEKGEFNVEAKAIHGFPRTDEEIRFTVYKMGDEIFSLYLELVQGYAKLAYQKTNIKANMEANMEADTDEKDEKFDFTDVEARFGRITEDEAKEVKKRYKDIRDRGECTDLKSLDITGEDVINLGYRGKEVGEVLKYLLIEVLKKPELNNKSDLIKIIEDYRGL